MVEYGSVASSLGSSKRHAHKWFEYLRIDKMIQNLLYIDYDDSKKLNKQNNFNASWLDGRITNSCDSLSIDQMIRKTNKQITCDHDWN